MFGMGTGSGSSLEPPGRQRTKCKLVFFSVCPWFETRRFRVAPHHEDFHFFDLILRSRKAASRRMARRMGIGNERRSRSIERLGPVSSTPHGVRRLHTRPINVVVYDGS